MGNLIQKARFKKSLHAVRAFEHGGEDGAGRRGLQRWGSRAAADRNGTADGAGRRGGGAGRRGGRLDEQEARWTSKCGGYGLGRARQRECGVWLAAAGYGVSGID
ncbi:uncharacterized protein LOC120685894 [Panicum virgatum]|uniref:uncharacterized protein LOC120685894 n=1 Tax=Panicum virgatum TaxID=38727 RepID=UPI0019D536F3|nr:uncharacterized protein LOC120685894 [Panicum virgatum]